MKSRHRSCQAFGASPHFTACSAVPTAANLSDSLLSSLPAWSLGLDVRSVLVLRCTCTRQRWIRVPSHASPHAAFAPRSPSVISTSGAGSLENRARYAALDSCARHCHPNVSPVPPSMAVCVQCFFDDAGPVPTEDVDETDSTGDEPGYGTSIVKRRRELGLMT